MTLWRYRAVPLSDPRHGPLRRGELSAETEAEVRESLRRVDLQVIDLRRASRVSWPKALPDPIRRGWLQMLRRRRGTERAELFDSLATMLASGIALPDALGAVLDAQDSEGAPRRRLVASLRETLRSGRSLAEAARQQEGWFDPVDVAILESGERSGTLPEVLSDLAQREERTEALTQKIAGALAYPCVVLTVGAGVVAFLSTKTLPEFARVLEEAELEVPALTRHVMSVGQGLFGWGGLVLILAILGLIGLLAWRAQTSGERPSSKRGRVAPAFVRRLAVAPLARRLSELAHNGVPVVEALRILLPTVASPALRAQVRVAVTEVEGGRGLAEALRTQPWFDGEFCQLVEVGERSGEMPRVLRRLADRYERRSARLIERLTTLLEPVVILILAALVGVVALAAVLPMIRLQQLL